MKALDAGEIRDGAPKGQVAIEAMIKAGLGQADRKGSGLRLKQLHAGRRDSRECST